MKSGRILELRRGDKAKAVERHSRTEAGGRLRAILRRSSKVGRSGNKVEVEFATPAEAEEFGKLARSVRQRPKRQPA